jgi:hypothetical protein
MPEKRLYLFVFEVPKLRTLIGHVKVIELTGVTDCDVSKHTLQT